MEVRATFGGAKGSRALVSALLVALAVAVGAAGGYVAASLGGSKAVQTHGTVTAAETNAQRELLPGYVQQEIAQPAPAPRLSQDSREFIQKYGEYSWVPGSEYAIPQDSAGFIQKYGEDSSVSGNAYAIP